MKEVLKLLGAFLFIGLMLVKASAFHIYEHHDDLSEQDTQCEYCVLIIDSQQSDLFLSFQDIVDEDIVTIYCQGKITSVDFQVNLSPSKTELLPRPPPSTL